MCSGGGGGATTVIGFMVPAEGNENGIIRDAPPAPPGIDGAAGAPGREGLSAGPAAGAEITGDWIDGATGVVAGSEGTGAGGGA